MIEKLTDEQISKFPEYVKKWTDIGLCTDTIDKDFAKKAIDEVYLCGGLKPPKEIIFADSPLGGSVLFSIFKNDSVKDAIKDNVIDTVKDLVWNISYKDVLDTVENNLSFIERINNSLWGKVYGSLNSSGESIRSHIWSKIYSDVGSSVWRIFKREVKESVWDSIWESVGDSVWDSVGRKIFDNISESPKYACYGQHDANWLGVYDFFNNECGLKDETKRLSGLIKAGQLGWFWCFENIAIVTDRPCEIHKDDNGELHHESKPALLYRDGWALYG